MNKADLIKLAEVAGLEIRVANENLIWIQEDGHDSVPWEPSFDIAQAFEVLEGLGMRYTIEKIITDKATSWLCVIDPINRDINHGRFGDTPSEAICQAVLRATRSKGE